MVDDNLDAADSLAALRQLGGHRTLVCDHAASVLRLLGQEMPDALEGLLARAAAFLREAPPRA